MIAALAVLVLFWDQGPETAPALRSAGISHIAVPSANQDQWKGVDGISVEPLDPSTLVKLTAPGVEYHMSEASATGVPWINANGWRIQRNPEKTYFYDAKGRAAGLAAAEAAAWNAHAFIHTDTEGLRWLASVFRVASATSLAGEKPVANIGLVDDGSPKVGEVSNLLARYNLLFAFEPKPDNTLPLNVQIGSAKYPVAEANDPHEMALHIRGDLGDDNRSLRIYGSQVVVGKLVEASGHAQLRLINYGNRPLQGLRVRIRGTFPNQRATEANIDEPKLMDATTTPDTTEFTLVQLDTYAVIDLTR